MLCEAYEKLDDFLFFTDKYKKMGWKLCYIFYCSSFGGLNRFLQTRPQADGPK